MCIISFILDSMAFKFDDIAKDSENHVIVDSNLEIDPDAFIYIRISSGKKIEKGLKNKMY